jgi:hypothetical protein
VIASPTTQSRTDDATFARARQSITDYLQANVVDARGDIPTLALCYQVPAFMDVGSLLAVARARVLDVQAAGSSHGPRFDSLSVLAELLVVALGRRSEKGWIVEKNIQLDSLRLMLVPARYSQTAVWSLCWSGYAASDFPGAPAFLRVTDSTAIEGLEWEAPMKGRVSIIT